MPVEYVVHQTAAAAPASIRRHELEHGVPLFLSQLSETLRLEATPTAFDGSAIGDSAARHGGELLATGFTVGQARMISDMLCGRSLHSRATAGQVIDAITV
jgi:hypothetical protein